MKKILCMSLLVGLMFAFGCDEDKNASKQKPTDQTKQSSDQTTAKQPAQQQQQPLQKPTAQPEKVMVKLQTSKGDIVIELDEEKAPITVKNFLSYVKDGHYDGTIFHRVIKGFMIQGGGFTPDFKQKPTNAPIKNEASNGLKNLRGTIAMARTNVPDSATCQFFINHADNAFLDYAPNNPGYAVFGKVTEGMDVVDAIANVPTGIKAGMRDVPTEDVLIQSATIVTR